MPPATAGSLWKLRPMHRLLSFMRVWPNALHQEVHCPVQMSARSFWMGCKPEMVTKSPRHSPILGAASMMIRDASDTLVTSDSRFRHSFEVALDVIDPDPDQARKQYAPEDIAALANTMAAQGQLQPILLRRHPSDRGKWIIVAGERRWRAAQLNSWPTILAIEHEKDPEVASLVENLQRVDLNPVEEARGVLRLMERKQWTQDQAANVLGKPKSEVSALLRIISLPSDLLDSVLTSELAVPRNVMVELARVGDVT